MNEDDYKTLQNDCGAIRRMLISSLKTIKSNKGLGIALDSICTDKCDAGSIRRERNFVNIIEHYDKLIDENNDPVYDPEPLKEYMNKWDGQVFIDIMKLDKTKTVLEIGVGTGRLALKTVPRCKEFVGIDLSSKTIDRATHNLSQYKNARVICGDFMTYNFDTSFDVIYSSLTFMHIQEKQECINKIYSLLKSKGYLVLSIDKNQNDCIDYGERKIKIYPDNPDATKKYFINSGLSLLECIETEFAYIFVGSKI